MPFFPLASRFTTFLPENAQKSKFCLLFFKEKVTYVFRPSDFLNFFFAFPFSPSLSLFWLQWLTFYWACFRFKKIPSKRHRDGLFLPWSSHMKSQQILFLVFQSTFWAFSGISQAPLGWPLWSGYHWKDLFLLQKFRVDDAHFGQR